MMRAQSETSTGNTQCSDFIHEMKRIYGQLNQLKGMLLIRSDADEC